MRKITSLVAALLLSVATFAQAPQGFSYQAVVRDAQNAIVSNQTVDVTLTITAEIDGEAVQTYAEKHSVTTNANGLFTLVVGQGESKQKLSDIKWNMPNAIYNMRTETAYGTATTQLLSVPFALYAEQAGELDYQKLAKTLTSDEVQAVLGYVKANDLADYAKKSDIPAAADLSGFAKTDTLGSYALNSTLADYAKTTDVANGYVTKETFENYVLSGGDAESVDLTVYAKTADVEAAYAKTADVEAAYAKKTDIPAAVNYDNFVTKRYLTDSANFITEHQSLAGYARIADIDSTFARKSDIPAAADLSSYAKTADVAAGYVSKETFDNYVLSGGQADSVDLTVYAKTADVEAAYATKAELSAKADAASLATVATSGSYNDLTNKPTIPTVPTNVSAFTNDAGYLTATDVANNAGMVNKLDKVVKENFGNELALSNSDVVDLGLSSGNLWASCNLGADSPEEIGGFYSWGETTTKDVYTWATYRYGDTLTAISKYCSVAAYGNNGFTDALTALEADDDAATANLGRGWNMPTIAEWEELYNQCYWEQTADYNNTGKGGYIVYKSINKTLDKQQTKGSDHTYSIATDAHIFIPLTGYIQDNDMRLIAENDHLSAYWSATLDRQCPCYARCVRLWPGTEITTDAGNSFRRAYAASVRPIRRADASVLSNYATVAQLQAQVDALQEVMAQLTQNANAIGDMPLATVNVVVTNVDNVATVSFLGQELKSGTTTFKIPAYSPVFLSVVLSQYQREHEDPSRYRDYYYSYTVKINGVSFDPVLGYYYAVRPTTLDGYMDDNGRFEARGMIEYDRSWGRNGQKYPDDVTDDAGFQSYLTWMYYPSTEFIVEKKPIYKSGSGKVPTNPYDYYSTPTDAERNMVNQVVGPFPNATNTIEIVVTRSGGSQIVN